MISAATDTAGTGCNVEAGQPEHLTLAEVAGIVEATRMQRIIDLDRRIASLKLERECLASQVRNEMQRDGVLRSKIPGVGTFTLSQPKTVHPCESCLVQFGLGDGELGSYLFVKPEAR